MTFGRFMGAIVVALFATTVLVWVFVSAAAFLFAMSKGDGGAAGLYAGLVVAGLLVGALAWWIGRRVVKAPAQRH